MRVPRVIKAAAIGYGLGLLPSADIAARLASRGKVKPIDLRREGSGNPGGLNALNVLGSKFGYAVMVGDIGKGAAASVIGRIVAGSAGSHIAATMTVVGHCFPVNKRFKGGKGVGASVGQCLATFPAYFPVDLAVAALAAANPTAKHRAYEATAVSSAFWVVGGVVWWRKKLPNLWGPKPTVMLPLANAASSAVILYKFATARKPMPTTR